MRKPETHFPQVPVEVAKKIAREQFEGDSARRPKRKSNGNGPAQPRHGEEESEGEYLRVRPSDPGE